jgi:50S ribosomal subunit-associated GTPase HflX
MIVVATKIDAVNPEKLAKLQKHCKKLKLELLEISAVTGKGIKELKYAIGKRVADVRAGTWTEPKKEKTVASARKAKKKAESALRFSKSAAFKKRQRSR